MTEKSILAPIKPYLKYSMDLEEEEPIVSYSCKLFFVENGIKIMGQNPTKTTPAMKTFIMDQMKTLEGQKKDIDMDKEGMKDMLIDFCSRVFAKADKEERTVPTITKINAITFNSAAHFIKLLTLFDAFSSDWESKGEKYCKWKAANILKALKQGTEPIRGHPNEQEGGENPFGLGAEGEEEAKEPVFVPPQAPPPTGPPASAYERDLAIEDKFDQLKARSDQYSIGGQGGVPDAGTDFTTPPPVQPPIQPPHPPYQPPIQPPYQPPPPPPPTQPTQPPPPAQYPPPTGPPINHPPPQPAYVSPPVKPAPPLGNLITRKERKYFDYIRNAKKALELSVNELEFNKVGNAKKFLHEAMESLNLLEDS